VNNSVLRFWLFTGSVAVVALLILFATFGSWYQVDQGERVVLLRNGEFIKVSTPGLGFKMPFFDEAHTVSIRDSTFGFKDVEAYSFDQQPAHLQISVIYRVLPDQVRQLYEMYGTRANMQKSIMEQKVLDETKKVFGQYNAMNAIQNRRELVDHVNAAIKQSLEGIPLHLVGVQLEDISFSEAYKKSIENRMLAEVEIQTTRQQKTTSEVNAEIQVIKANAAADAKRAQFTAEADGIRVRGEAEASAILARSNALASNTNLVNLNAVEKWDGKFPTTMIPGSALPFIGVK